MRAWWGEFDFATGTWGHWQVGPLELWVGRTAFDWHLAYDRAGDPFRDEIQVEMPFDLQRSPLPDGAKQHRVAYARTDSTLRLSPMLADRPVVARPETTFAIPSGERVSVFVSSAVWIRLSSSEGPLLEVPSWRSSDTWFGDNRSGFLCYATRTTMRMDVTELPTRSHRVVTPIVIENRGKDALDIVRISLPMPNLSVFALPSGGLWTDKLHMTRDDDAELAQVRIERGSPIADAQQLCTPREVSEDNLLSRVFTGLFG